MSEQSNYLEKLNFAFANALQALLHDYPDKSGILSGTVGRNCVTPAKSRKFGDYSSAIALKIASSLNSHPVEIAKGLVSRVELPDFVEAVTLAGAYINIKIKAAAKSDVICEILKSPKVKSGTAGHIISSYGMKIEKQKNVLLEFVSANPTGPLHVGHGRAAVFGDVLANLMDFSGYHVFREYYVNDAGRQIKILAASVWIRYFSSGDSSIHHGLYQGGYLSQISSSPMIKNYLHEFAPPNFEVIEAEISGKGDDHAVDIFINAFLNASEDKNKINAYISAISAAVMKLIKQDLTNLGVSSFDFWFSEKTLHENKNIDDTISLMRDKLPDAIYDNEGAIWFRSTLYGDDKDRVLRRADSRWTYFAADVAYHLSKLTRISINDKESILLNIMGADHHWLYPAA